MALSLFKSLSTSYSSCYKVQKIIAGGCWVIFMHCTSGGPCLESLCIDSEEEINSEKKSSHQCKLIIKYYCSYLLLTLMCTEAVLLFQWCSDQKLAITLSPLLCGSTLLALHQGLIALNQAECCQPLYTSNICWQQRWWYEPPTIIACLLSAQSLRLQGSMMAMIPVRGNSRKKCRMLRNTNDVIDDAPQPKRKSITQFIKT